MKAMFLGAALAVLAAPAAAQTGFDGTYKVDIGSAQLPDKPLNRALKGGVYHCDCDIPMTVPADGAWHKVTGRPRVDSLRVIVIGDDGLRIEGRQGEKLVYATTDQVSADGMVNNWTNTDFTPVSGEPLKASGQDKRVGAAPAKGLHKINGGWVTSTDGLKVDPAGLTVVMKSVPGGMSVTIGTGETYQAQFGGPAVPITNDAPGTMVRLRQISATSFAEEISRNGKPIALNTFVAAPDGSIAVTSQNPIQNTKTSYKLIRQ